MESILLPKEKLEFYLNFIRQIQDGDLSIHMDGSASVPELIEFECIKQVDGTAGRNVRYTINI